MFVWKKLKNEIFIVTCEIKNAFLMTKVDERKNICTKKVFPLNRLKVKIILCKQQLFKSRCSIKKYLTHVFPTLTKIIKICYVIYTCKVTLHCSFSDFSSPVD